MKRYFVLALLPFLIALSSCSSTSPSAPAASPAVFVASFQNGLLPYASYTGCLDTLLDESYPTTSYNSNPGLIAGQLSGGKNRILIKFNLSSIDPNTVKVKAAYLKLTNTYGSGSFNAYKVTSSWSIADWNTTNSVTNWTTPGGDYNSTIASGWTVVSTTGSELILTLDNTMVEGWINNTLTNYGVLIAGLNEGTTDYQEADFESSESASTDRRPKLTVYYTLE